MISVEAALAHMQAHQIDFGTEVVSLLRSGNRILAQDVIADRDFPPYDRITMDGIAINSSAFEAGCRDFKIEQIQPAGHPQLQLAHDANCIEVMTGAILPREADIVIPYEDCSLVDGMASVNVDAIRPHQNIHLRGTDAKRSDVLIEKGSRISPAMIGVLASVGMDSVPVRRMPGIAICGTGDELVAVSAMPLAHQVRRSNSYMLAAALDEEGIAADMYHLPDNKAAMEAQLSDMLPRYDVVLFSGAVSKGKYDYLPEVLAGLGMQPVFHRVAQKPGKPFLFGKFEQPAVMVFGFPGNPVSTLVCYKVFFQRWLRGSLEATEPIRHARLTEDIYFKPALSYHLLVTLKVEQGILLATPCAGANSGDIISLQKADAILTLPEERQRFRQGDAYPVILLRPFF